MQCSKKSVRNIAKILKISQYINKVDIIFNDMIYFKLSLVLVLYPTLYLIMHSLPNEDPSPLKGPRVSVIFKIISDYVRTGVRAISTVSELELESTLSERPCP